MSQYLVERIDAHRQHRGAAADRDRRAVGGDDHLECAHAASTAATGDEEQLPANWLFVFIGASPRTDWLGDVVARDDKGFILTGPDVCMATATRHAGRCARPPFLLETSVPGVFAAGDVRLDSMKRVASAVGEGAMAVNLVHRYLETM